MTWYCEFKVARPPSSARLPHRSLLDSAAVFLHCTGPEFERHYPAMAIGAIHLESAKTFYDFVKSTPGAGVARSIQDCSDRWVLPGQRVVWRTSIPPTWQCVAGPRPIGWQGWIRRVRWMIAVPVCSVSPAESRQTEQQKRSCNTQYPHFGLLCLTQ